MVIFGDLFLHVCHVPMCVWEGNTSYYILIWPLRTIGVEEYPALGQGTGVRI